MISRDDATVLVVDDEEGVRESYAISLETEGFDVRTAGTAGEALVEIGSVVDVVLLDRRMPGMSGDEVLEHIRDWQVDCRVVMVTAVDPGPDIMEMPFDDYLNKPVSKEELVDTVEQLLLFDRYETLLSEYHSVVRKYAVLLSHVGNADPDGTLATLENRRDELRDELVAVVEGFTDDEVTSVFRDLHSLQ